jgi:hypothetical protein
MLYGITIKDHAMAWCESQFRTFSENLKLDQTRLGRISSALEQFASYSRRDPELSVALTAAPFLQGSVSTKTAIRPLSGDEFDVDVIYPFTLSAFTGSRTPKSIINWFLARLRADPFYAAHLIPKDRCARIDYAGDFHMDIIPSTADVLAHQPYAVPAHDLADWKANNPRGFQHWVEGLDTRSCHAGGVDKDGVGRFVRSVRVLKRWRDEFFTGDATPSSMLLVTMLGKHEPNAKYNPPLEYPLFPKYPFEAAYIYDMLRITLSCLRLHPESSFMNPSLPEEDLAGEWKDKHLAEFMLKLTACIEQIMQGILSDSEPQAIIHYKKAFGASFPS